MSIAINKTAAFNTLNKFANARVALIKDADAGRNHTPCLECQKGS